MMMDGVCGIYERGFDDCWWMHDPGLAFGLDGFGLGLHIARLRDGGTGLVCYND